MEKQDPILIKINFSLNSKLNFPKDATILDLKNQISKNFLIREEEYELFLGDNSLADIPNKTMLSTVIEKFNTTNFSLKSSKNFFDLKKQLIDYNEFLDKNIKAKEEEIKQFNEKYINFQKEIKEVENNNMSTTQLHSNLNFCNDGLITNDFDADILDKHK